MLVHETSAFTTKDPLNNLIAELNGNELGVKELRQGVYLIGHFSSDLGQQYKYPQDLPVYWYGVCDNVDQLLAACPELETSERQFIIFLTPIKRKVQGPKEWRWHKWGEYIGTQKPQYEYLYDDTHIDEVFVYQILERME